MSRKPLSILYIEDEPDLLELVGEQLKGPNIEITLSASPRKALDRLKSQGVDILIVDLHLPELGGAEFLMELFDQGYFSKYDCKVIVLTGDLEWKDFHDSRLKGMATILYKPFGLRQLGAEVLSFSEERSKLPQSP